MRIYLAEKIKKFEVGSGCLWWYFRCLPSKCKCSWAYRSIVSAIRWWSHAIDSKVPGEAVPELDSDFFLYFFGVPARAFCAFYGGFELDDRRTNLVCYWINCCFSEPFECEWWLLPSHLFVNNCPVDSSRDNHLCSVQISVIMSIDYERPPRPIAHLAHMHRSLIKAHLVDMIPRNLLLLVLRIDATGDHGAAKWIRTTRIDRHIIYCSHSIPWRALGIILNTLTHNIYLLFIINNNHTMAKLQ